MTTIPPITPLPSDVPSTSDPANFDERADTFLAALPTFGSQLNTSIGAMNAVAGEVEDNAEAAAGSKGGAEAAAIAADASANMAVAVSTYVAFSASSHSATTGAKTFTGLQAGRSFQDGDAVVIKRRGDPALRLYGSVNVGGYNSGANTLAVTISQVVGSGGPFTDWIILHAAFEQLAPASTSEIRGGSDTLHLLNVKGTYDALAEVTLTNSGTNIITTGDAAPNHTKFINAYVVLAGNWTLPNLLTPKVGDQGRIRVQQDATGGRTLAYGANWKPEFGVTPVMPTAANAIAIIDFDVIATNYTRFRMTSM